MDKQTIIDAIKLIAAENGGKPPGKQAFSTGTGIKSHEWYPHLWLRWGDALAEAGFPPNQWQTAISDELAIQKYIELTRELGRIPLVGELRRKSKSDSLFPSDGVFGRFGGKRKLIAAVRQYCESNPGFEDVLPLFANHTPGVETSSGRPKKGKDKVATGFVYLMKSGGHYKIGRTVSVGSRERQLAIKIPVPPKTIHSIETDDPVGVEAYWHNRFREKRGEGEWFELSPADIAAFKRWKRIV